MYCQIAIPLKGHASSCTLIIGQISISFEAVDTKTQHKAFSSLLAVAGETVNRRSRAGSITRNSRGAGQAILQGILIVFLNNGFGISSRVGRQK